MRPSNQETKMESSGNQHEPNSFSENTSGQGKSAIVPKEIQGWNWGAFLLSWIWGLAHNVPLSLLMFVPGVNIVMWFMLGIKGSTWAWQKKRWQSIEEFKRKQKTWSITGFSVAGVFTLMIVVAGIGGVEKNSNSENGFADDEIEIVRLDNASELHVSTGERTIQALGQEFDIRSRDIHIEMVIRNKSSRWLSEKEIAGKLKLVDENAVLLRWNAYGKENSAKLFQGTDYASRYSYYIHGTNTDGMLAAGQECSVNITVSVEAKDADYSSNFLPGIRTADKIMLELPFKTFVIDNSNILKKFLGQEAS